MRTDQFVTCKFEDELTALIARKQSPKGETGDQALFEALLGLENRAQTGNAPASTVRKISETRFLVGILRGAVRPVPMAPLRALLRMREPLRGRAGTRPLADLDLGA